MGKVKTSYDLRNMASDAIDLLIDGKITPDQASAISKLGNLMLKTAIEEARYRSEQDAPVEFFEETSGEIMERSKKRIGPRFEWDDNKKTSFGSYVGTRLTMKAFLDRNDTYGWEVKIGNTQTVVGSGDDKANMEQARRMAEVFATEYFKQNEDAQMYLKGA